MKQTLTSILAVVASLAIAEVAEAAEARIPIFGTTTISTPGTYFLSRAVSGAGPLITVTANDVEIDLNGFTLSPSSGAGVFVSDAERVSIHDGFVVGGQSAVRFDGVEGGRIERISASASSAAGLTLAGSTGIVVRDVILRDTGGEGIKLDGAALADPAQIEITRTQILRSTGDAILLINAGSSLVAENTISAPVARGIKLETCKAVEVRGNAIREAGLGGIALVGSLGCRVTGNVVRFAATDGLIVDSNSTDNTLSGNQATESGSYGIEVGGDRNVLSDNIFGGNTKWGLFFNANSNDNVYRGNVARGNASPGGCAGATSDFCNKGVNNTSNNDNYAPALL